jgi:NifU-like protein
MSDNLMDIFFNPRNVGDANEPSFTGSAGSFVCGAAATFSIQIDESQNISEAKFRAAGCEALVASLSLLTERVKGKSTASAAEVGHAPQSLITGLRLGPTHIHCAQLACDSLVTAIREYSNAVRDEWNGDEALICTCFFVSEQTIEREIRQRGLTTLGEVTSACGAGGGCGSCQPLILEILEAIGN